MMHAEDIDNSCCFTILFMMHKSRFKNEQGLFGLNHCTSVRSRLKNTSMLKVRIKFNQSKILTR